MSSVRRTLLFLSLHICKSKCIRIVVCRATAFLFKPPCFVSAEGALEMSSVGRPPLYVWVECIQISNILSEVNTPEKSSVWQPPLCSSLDVYLSLLHSNLNHSKWSKCTRKVVCMATVILFKPLCMTETLSFYLLMSIIPTAFQIQSRHCIVYTLTHSGLVMPWDIFEKVVCKSRSCCSGRSVLYQLLLFHSNYTIRVNALFMNFKARVLTVLSAYSLTVLHWRHEPHRLHISQNYQPPLLLVMASRLLATRYYLNQWWHIDRIQISNILTEGNALQNVVRIMTVIFLWLPCVKCKVSATIG